jgi:hypothetical protein
MPTSPSGAGSLTLPSSVTTTADDSQAGRLTYAWRPPRASGTVLLIHGLGGNAAHTWGADQDGGFLGRLMRPGPGFAVACYDYSSRLGLPGQGGLPTLARLSERLAATIRDELVPAGRRVAIVAYCLGGLIARFAVPGVLAAGPGTAQRRGGFMLLLLDAPEDWPDGPLGTAMTAITRRLALDERALRANAAWWADRSGLAGQVEDYAVVSDDHCWITPFKPGSTVPARRVLHSGIGHLGLTRPPAVGRHEAYDHVAACLGQYFGEPEGTTGRPGDQAG